MEKEKEERGRERWYKKTCKKMTVTEQVNPKKYKANWGSTI